jgi:hypothetical protein
MNGKLPDTNATKPNLLVSIVFFRVDTSRSQASGGTGLGLAIVAENHAALTAGNWSLPGNRDRAPESHSACPSAAKNQRLRKRNLHVMLASSRDLMANDSGRQTKKTTTNKWWALQDSNL